MDAVHDLGAFLRADPLEEVSDQVQVSSVGDLHRYAYRARGAAGEDRYCMVFFSAGEDEAVLREIRAPWIRPGMHVRSILAHNDRPREEEETVLNSDSWKREPPWRFRESTEDTLLILLEP